MREDFSRSEFPRRSVYLLFAADNLGVSGELVKNCGVACFEDKSGTLLRLMLELIEVGERRGDGGYWEAMSKLCLIIDALGEMRHLAGEAFMIPASEDNISPEIRAAMAAIRRDAAKPFSLLRLAASLGVTTSTLSHRFTHEAGCPPLAFRSKVRLELAKRMLTLGEPVKQVAEKLGYCDVHHFSKHFKRLSGMTPGEFRGG